MKYEPKEIQDGAKYGSEEGHQTVLGRLMEYFFDEMMAKFYARLEKHPGESSVTNDNYDWAGSSLPESQGHLIEEFLERFPEFRDRFPEFKHLKLTLDGPEVEDIDLANLAFYDWACRIMRAKTDDVR